MPASNPPLAQVKAACEDLKQSLSPGRGNIQAVYVGYKTKGGKRTDQLSCVVAVDKKRPLGEVPPSLRVPPQVAGIPTDVVETGKFKALSLTSRLRPAPGGASCGHHRITAGTLGCWVLDRSGNIAVLSNNHVLADSNGGSPGDRILQPGPVDGGSQGSDTLAQLTDFVRINFKESPLPPIPPPKGDKRTASLAWKAAKALPNGIARMMGCPYRLVVTIPKRSVDQPSPNLVDAALASPLILEDADRVIYTLGPLIGVRDLTLGDRVQKFGRTTEHTQGSVEGIDGSVEVDYGDQGTALYEKQVFIRADSGEFSAGGDSGSVILTSDMYLGGLLFAGGTGLTVANRISDVISFLGIRLP